MSASFRRAATTKMIPKNFLLIILLIYCFFFVRRSVFVLSAFDFLVQSYEVLSLTPNIWDNLHEIVTNGKVMCDYLQKCDEWFDYS